MLFLVVSMMIRALCVVFIDTMMISEVFVFFFTVTMMLSALCVVFDCYDDV